ncbi:MAG: carboxymuconolactone decarboxylase family protein [Planctomycetota bacterium]
MSAFHVHTQETTSDAGREVLTAAKKKFGFVPNLMGVLAEAPAAAKAYATLGDLVAETSFTPTERHVVWFTINAYHDCRYCMAAHTTIAKAEKIPDQIIDEARADTGYSDERLNALRDFTLHLTDQRGWVDQTQLEAFHAAGYTKQHVLEIITVLAHKVLSNYTNHLAETPIDGVFAPHAWEPQDAAV